jgi:enamine deaminase RidA (YjgF/YER057c/UK114 family)
MSQTSENITRMETAKRMSKIVKHNGVAYLCGQVGNVEKGQDVSAAQQTADILDKVDALLAQAGSSKDRILQAIIWVSDMQYFAEMNEVWDAWVPEGHAPARACGEAKLARPELLVEIIITAACD